MPMDLPVSRELRSRVDDRINAWRVSVERVSQTQGSILAFGRRGTQPVVLKVIKDPGDEWRSGEIVDAFDGKGVVRVYEYVEGAMLLERACPGTHLVSIALNADDDRATEILVDVIGRMSPCAPAHTVPTVEAWAKGFERYVAGGSTQIPTRLVLDAHRLYTDLCCSQSQARLLHGDLHHSNVLFDSDRGWVAVDPKGVAGELEYEIGAALRNPQERPNLFTDPTVIEARAQRFAHELHLDARRILAWGFAQAVLSAIWAAEDGLVVEPNHPCIVLANAIRPTLGMEGRTQP